MRLARPLQEVGAGRGKPRRERDHLTSAVPARLSPLAATQDKSPPLPRTTKKNIEVGAALYGPESSSYPLAVETLKDRTVSWVRPNCSDLVRIVKTYHGSF